MTSPAIPCTTYAGPASSDPSTALRPFIASGALAGAVTLVADADGVRSHGAIGWADVEGGRAMAGDALFWIASMTKPMTGALLTLLVEEGRVSLDDPVERHLPEFAGQQLALPPDAAGRIALTAPARPITLRDCLAHTSGLPFQSRPEAGIIDRFTLREACLTYALTPLTAQPGTAYQYSNAGINIAGRIAEVVTGARYADLMHERLLAPLGMRDTTFWPDGGQLARLARTYAGDGGTRRAIPTPQVSHPLDARDRQPSPAGGYFSTAADLGRFARMVLAGGSFDGRRLLSAASVREMTRKQTGSLEPSYGLGWKLDGACVGHAGAIGTDLRIDPELGLAMIYLVQQSGQATPDAKDALPAFRASAARLRR